MPEPESHRSTTWLAQHRFQFDASCEGCHTIENPGGDDNSSFCSNGACHGAEWKFVGLNAPRIRELSAPPRVPSSGQPNPIPHPVTQRTDCNDLPSSWTACGPMPENHAGFTRDMCTSCHKPTLEETAAPAAATPAPAPERLLRQRRTPAIPHEVAGREDCLVCHNPDGGLKPAPADHKGRRSARARAAISRRRGGRLRRATAEPATAARRRRLLRLRLPRLPGARGRGGAGDPARDGRSRGLPVCHNPDGGVKPAPADHKGRPATRARVPPGCGRRNAQRPRLRRRQRRIPSIPHAVAGQENCLACHNPDGGMKPAPADHAGRPVESCQGCHKPA